MAALTPFHAQSRWKMRHACGGKGVGGERASGQLEESDICQWHEPIEGNYSYTVTGFPFSSRPPPYPPTTPTQQDGSTPTFPSRLTPRNGQTCSRLPTVSLSPKFSSTTSTSEVRHKSPSLRPPCCLPLPPALPSPLSIFPPTSPCPRLYSSPTSTITTRPLPITWCLLDYSVPQLTCA